MLFGCAISTTTTIVLAIQGTTTRGVAATKNRDRTAPALEAAALIAEAAGGAAGSVAVVVRLSYAARAQRKGPLIQVHKRARLVCQHVCCRLWHTHTPCSKTLADRNSGRAGFKP